MLEISQEDESEFFTGWPQVELVCPGIVLLAAELIVRFRDSRRRQAVPRSRFDILVDRAIDDDIG